MAISSLLKPTPIVVVRDSRRFQSIKWNSFLQPLPSRLGFGMLDNKPNLTKEFCQKDLNISSVVCVSYSKNCSSTINLEEEEDDDKNPYFLGFMFKNRTATVSGILGLLVITFDQLASVASGARVGGKCFPSSSSSTRSSSSSRPSEWYSSSSSSSSRPSESYSSSSSSSSRPSGSYSSSSSSSSSWSSPSRPSKSYLRSSSSKRPSDTSQSFTTSSSSTTDLLHSSTSYAPSPRHASKSYAFQTVGIVIITMIVVWTVGALTNASVNSQSPPPPPEEQTSVIKLQVCLLGMARSLQKDLEQLAEVADTSKSEGLNYILKEATLALLRHPDFCISSYSSVDVKESFEDGEQRFDRLSIEKRGKFDEETLFNVNNIKRKMSSRRQRETGSRNEYIVAVEVLWTPQEEDDTLSEQELLEKYPLLKPLHNG